MVFMVRDFVSKKKKMKMKKKKKVSRLEEIIRFSGRPRHLSTISPKNFHLFKITEFVINFYLKKNSN